MTYRPEFVRAFACAAPLYADPTPDLPMTIVRAFALGTCSERLTLDESIGDFEWLTLKILLARPSSVVRLSGGPGTGQTSLHWWCSEAHRLLDEQRWSERVARREAPPINELLPTHLHYGQGGHPR